MSMRFWVGNDSANEERSMKDVVVKGITLRAPCVPWNPCLSEHSRTQDDSPTNIPIFKCEPALRAEGSLSQ